MMTAIHKAWRVAACGLLVLVVTGGMSVAQQNDARRTPAMTLSGTGQVSAKPDTATVSSGVVTEADTAREALERNNSAMRAVLDAVSRAGIKPEQVRTSGFSVQPRYYYPPQPKKGEPAEAPRIVGYAVSNSVSVEVHDLDKLGGVLDSMVGVGANKVEGISFSIRDDEALLDQAREKAVKDALRKAQIYARAAGVALGRITSISEARAIVPHAPMFRAEAMAKDASVPVEAGQTSLSVSVTMTWQLSQ